jgi:hypothetical protein
VLCELLPVGLDLVAETGDFGEVLAVGTAEGVDAAFGVGVVAEVFASVVGVVDHESAADVALGKFSH